jgi:hypothetical protein
MREVRERLLELTKLSQSLQAQLMKLPGESSRVAMR